MRQCAVRAELDSRRLAIPALAHKTNLRPRTRELYAHELRAHIYPKLGAIELAKLCPKTVREWHSGLTKGSRLGANTAAKCYRLLLIAGFVGLGDLVKDAKPARVARPRDERATEPI